MYTYGPPLAARELMKGRSAKVPVRIDDYAVYIGGRFSLSFQRTLRLPHAGADYPRPPRLGNFRIYRTEDFLTMVPPEWADSAGIFIPIYGHEALSLAFGGVAWKPNALLVALDGTNALSAEPLSLDLRPSPQNYLISPHQPWLTAAHTPEGTRQFVPSCEDGSAAHIDVVVYDPRMGIFPNEPLSPAWPEGALFEESVQPYRMGLSADPLERSALATSPSPDPYGPQTWESEPCGRVAVHLVTIEQFVHITGYGPPHTPITPDTYAAAGLPWPQCRF